MKRLCLLVVFRSCWAGPQLRSILLQRFSSYASSTLILTFLRYNAANAFLWERLLSVWYRQEMDRYEQWRWRVQRHVELPTKRTYRLVQNFCRVRRTMPNMLLLLQRYTMLC